MKRLSTLHLVPGMVTAQRIVTMNNQLVLDKGTILTDKLITKLDLYGIFTVYVQDSVPLASEYSFAPKNPSYSQRIKNAPEFQQFKKEYENIVDSLQDIVSNVVEHNLQLDVSVLLKHTLKVLGICKGSIGILDMLQNMREYDDSTFAHCINVALVCNILAGWL